jgi:hypothetical protein
VTGAGDGPDAARLLGELGDPADQLLAVSVADAEVAEVAEGLERIVVGYLEERLPAAAAVLVRELVDPETMLRRGLAAWARAFADELERPGAVGGSGAA